MLRRGRRPSSADGPKVTATARPTGCEDVAASAEWQLGGDLGRRYAAVSGDRNPIHMHA